jgi:hypothetical protein
VIGGKAVVKPFNPVIQTYRSYQLYERCALDRNLVPRQRLQKKLERVVADE